jgi:hypothetical protein
MDKLLPLLTCPKNWFLTFGCPSVSGLGIFAASLVFEPQKAQKGKKEAGDH